MTRVWQILKREESRKRYRAIAQQSVGERKLYWEDRSRKSNSTDQEKNNLNSSSCAAVKNFDFGGVRGTPGSGEETTLVGAKKVYRSGLRQEADVAAPRMAAAAADSSPPIGETVGGGEGQ